MHRRVTKLSRVAAAAGLISMVAGAGCAHVNREEMATGMDGLRDEMRAEHEAAAAEQQAAHGELNGRIDGLTGRVDELDRRQAATDAKLEQLERDLEALETEFGVTIERLEGAIAFNVPVHFEFDSAALGEHESEVLDRFAGVYGTYYHGALVTVEGFTDEAGPEEYNAVLGKRRAEEVKSYLTEISGIAPERVRAVSYGEDRERLVAPGEWGKTGVENRRVVLVIDSPFPLAIITAKPPGE